MNNTNRAFITIVCSILLIMPSFLGVPLADGNIVLVPTPDSGQVNDEISTITDLDDDNIKTIVTTELLLQADSDESDLSDSDEIQEHGIRVKNGNEDNNKNSISTEHSAGAESDQSDDVNFTIVNDAPLPADTNLTAFEDALLNMLLNASDTGEETYTIVEQLDSLNGTLGIVTSNETTLAPTPDLTSLITSTIETNNSEFDNDVAIGVYDDSLTLVNPSQPIFGTLPIDQNNTTASTANLSSNASDSSQHTMSDGDGIANNEINPPPVESDDISSPIAENPQISAGLSTNDFDAGVDSPLIQRVDEIVEDNNGENTAFTSESSTIEESDSNSVDSVTPVVSNTNSGSNGEDDNNSNYGRSDENRNDDGRCSDNTVQDHGQDKHKHKDKNNNKDGDKGKGEERDDEHHVGSESSHDRDEGVSHNDSNHQNREGSDDDRNRHEHEDEHENNHDDDDHEEHDKDGEHNDE